MIDSQIADHWKTTLEAYVKETLWQKPHEAKQIRVILTVTIYLYIFMKTFRDIALAGISSSSLTHVVLFEALERIQVQVLIYYLIWTDQDILTNFNYYLNCFLTSYLFCSLLKLFKRLMYLALAAMNSVIGLNKTIYLWIVTLWLQIASIVATKSKFYVWT